MAEGWCVDRGRFAPTEEGTPQGGVISPVLMNVALHGLEQPAGTRYFADDRKDAGKSVPGTPVVVRYADDLVALCVSAEQAQQVKERLASWLAPRGLAFNEYKTRVVSLDRGFDFLGFNVRRYRNGKLLIKPSKEAIRRIRRLAAEVALHGANAEAVITRLNPIIRGWAATTGAWCPRRRSPPGSLRVAAHLPVGQRPIRTSRSAGHRPVLRHVQLVQTGPLGVRRPRQRPIPGQVLLDENRPAPDGHRRRVSGRPRPDRLLGPAATTQKNPAGGRRLARPVRAVRLLPALRASTAARRP